MLMGRATRKSVLALGLVSALSCQAADWTPQDVHPKVFQMVDAWVSDTRAPVVTEINLDAVRANRNQFDREAVRNEDGWITYRDKDETLRFKPEPVAGGQYVVRYQDNGGGTFTSARTIRFRIITRKMQVEGRETEISVLRVLAIDR